jgi:hypothetical protein
MPNYWKRALAVSARLSILGLLLVALLALGACGNMPVVEAPAEEDVVVEEVAPTTEADTDSPVESVSDSSEVAEEAGSEEADVSGEVQTDSEVEVAAETPEEEVAVPAVEDWTQHFVAEGQYIYVGNPEAAVTILDVSDFL